MGFLGFVKEIGHKLFNKEEEAPAAIKEYVEQDNPGVSGLDVKIDGGVVTLSGTADNHAALEKAVLLAGNVKGVSEVNFDGVTAPDATEDVEFYEIASGDTLSAIARKFYGNANDYPKIFAANREVIKDPDKIYPGQKIRIPK